MTTTVTTAQLINTEGLAGVVIHDPKTGPRFRVKTVDGFHIEVLPMFVNWRVHTLPVDGGPFAWSERFWCYEGRGQSSFVTAVLAAHAWDGGADTEPVGWVKSWDGRRHGRAVRDQDEV